MTPNQVESPQERKIRSRNASILIESSTLVACAKIVTIKRGGQRKLLAALIKWCTLEVFARTVTWNNMVKRSVVRTVTPRPLQKLRVFLGSSLVISHLRAAGAKGTARRKTISFSLRVKGQELASRVPAALPASRIWRHRPQTMVGLKSLNRWHPGNQPNSWSASQVRSLRCVLHRSQRRLTLYLQSCP